MKKILFSTLMVLAIVLAACSSVSTGTPAMSTSDGLPIETQIAVGTLKLAGTGQDVTAEQAEELIILWQTYKQLSESDTAAQAEVDGLIAQIQETMTTDQMQAITDMQIAQQDVFTSMQGVSVTTSSSSESTVSVPSGSASGGAPAGGPPSDGGGAPPDGGMGMDMGSGAPASGTDQNVQTGSSSQSITQVPSALVEAVIQSLQQKIEV
jgi:DNA-binding transcriptional regulator YiaG